jgi:hypothetical protein
MMSGFDVSVRRHKNICPRPAKEDALAIMAKRFLPLSVKWANIAAIPSAGIAIVRNRDRSEDKNTGISKRTATK